MAKKKITVNIGIPAYNEEKNILKLLTALLNQKSLSFTLQNIIIVSDASTDKTDRIVQSINDSRVVLIRNKQRKGQNYNENIIFNKSTSDILILLEADTLPLDNTYLETLISPMINDPVIEYVQGNMQPNEAKTFLGNVLRKQFNSYHLVVTNDKILCNCFSSGRGGRALSFDLYKKILLPLNVPEDTYILLYCKQQKITTHFNKDAICMYACPENLNDYINERKKISAAEQALKNYFDEKLINEIYRKPQYVTMKASIYFLLNNPIFFLYYVFLKLKIKRSVIPNAFKATWEMNTSTKNI